MRKFFLVLVVLGIVAAAGYVLGTEAGRGRRDEVISKVRKKSDGMDAGAAVQFGEDLTAKAADAIASPS